MIDLTIRLNLNNYINFVGIQQHPNLSKYFQACDVFIQPSINAKMENNFVDVETMGRSFIEASACKKPVIGSNLGGIPDVVINGETGILLDEPLNINSIVKAIIKLAKDKELRDKLGENGYKLVHAKFTWEKVGYEIEKLMIDVVNDRRNNF